jgi:hypothetical protein
MEKALPRLADGIKILGDRLSGFCAPQPRAEPDQFSFDESIQATGANGSVRTRSQKRRVTKIGARSCRRELYEQASAYVVCAPESGPAAIHPKSALDRC